MFIFLLGLVAAVCAIAAVVLQIRGKELFSNILIGVVIFLGIIGLMTFWIE